LWQMLKAASKQRPTKAQLYADAEDYQPSPRHPNLASDRRRNALQTRMATSLYHILTKSKYLTQNTTQNASTKPNTPKRSENRTQQRKQPPYHHLPHRKDSTNRPKPQNAPTNNKNKRPLPVTQPRLEPTHFGISKVFYHNTKTQPLANHDKTNTQTHYHHRTQVYRHKANPVTTKTPEPNRDHQQNTTQKTAPLCTSLSHTNLLTHHLPSEREYNQKLNDPATATHFRSAHLRTPKSTSPPPINARIKPLAQKKHLSAQGPEKPQAVRNANEHKPSNIYRLLRPKTHTLT